MPKFIFENCKQTAEKLRKIYSSQMHFGFPNMGLKVHHFKVISPWKVKNGRETPCKTFRKHNISCKSERNWCRRRVTLCSRNFQNVKLRLDFVELWSFYRHSDFKWNQILVISKGPKMLIFTILEVLNFDFSKRPKFTEILSSESLKLSKMIFLNRLNLPKFDFK